MRKNEGILELAGTLSVFAMMPDARHMSNVIG
jgi:hypothetical protein